MPSLLSPPAFPKFFSCCPTALKNDRKNKGFTTSIAPQGGNLTPCAAVSLLKPTRRRNARLATRREEVELLGSSPDQDHGGLENFLERHGPVVNKVEEDCQLAKDNGLSVTRLKHANFGSLEDNDSADKLLDELPGKDVQVLAAEKAVELLTTTRRSGKLHSNEIVQKIMSLPTEDRSKVLDLFECGDEILTISDYNDILISLVKAGELRFALDLFSDLPHRGVVPDSWSFSIMVRCLCKKNEAEEARRVLDDMIERGFYPNVVTCTILINCLCKRGKVTNAFEVFEIMNRIGCEPTVRTYNCLISGLCYVGRVEEACQLLRTMKDSPKTPDIYTFTLVMDGFCKVGRSDEAMKLLKEALEMAVVPTNVTYNTLLDGYCKEKRPLEGLRLLEEMQGRGYHPDFISYNTLLQGLLVCGEITEALNIYKKMREAEFQVQGRMMNTLLRGLCRQCLADGTLLTEAREVFDEIMETEYSISPYTYCLMIQALANAGEVDKALAYLLQMVRTGFSPRMMTYNVVLRVLCGEGRVDDALCVVVVMIERDTIPSKFSFSILLDEFIRQGRTLNAFGIYALALKRGMNLRWKPQKVVKDESELFATVREHKETSAGNEECYPG